MLVPGTYRWKNARCRPNVAHCDIASRLFTDSAVSTSTVPSSFRLRSVEKSTRSGYHSDSAGPTGAVCSFPGLMATSNFLLYFACSRRITRSCSSCSRTGRTRIGLNKTSDASTYHGVDAQPRVTRQAGGAGTGRNYGRGGQNITRLPHLTGFRPGSTMKPVPPSDGAPAPRVLIVDDDKSVTNLFSRMLRLEGYEVWAAHTADD